MEKLIRQIEETETEVIINLDATEAGSDWLRAGRLRAGTEKEKEEARLMDMSSMVLVKINATKPRTKPK